MSREVDEYDSDASLRDFVKSAEASLELASSAMEHAKVGDCVNASRFAFQAAEEIGVVRGIMGQAAAELRFAKSARNRERYRKTLAAMRADFDFLQQTKRTMFARSRRCFVGAPLPFDVTIRPSDGEEDE